MSMIRFPMYTAVSRLIGLVLAAAGILKGQEFIAPPVHPHNLAGHSLSTLLVVGFEALLGLCLLAGLFPRPAWRLTVFCFAIFFGISLDRAVSGEASCGCFGSLMVSPWFTALIDSAVLLALFTFPPSPQLGGVPATRRVRLAALGIPLLLASVLGGVFSNRSILSRLDAAHEMPASLLSPPSVSIDFGRMTQGGYGEKVIWLNNPGAEKVELSAIETSCECLQIGLSARSVAPGERMRAVVKLNLAKEPTFAGKLRIEATGHTPSNAVAFSIVARVQVVRE